MFIKSYDIEAAKDGNRPSGIKILEILKESLETGTPLPDDIKEYLILALDKITSNRGISADKAFNLAVTRGEKLTDSFHRDLTIYEKIEELKTAEERLEKIDLPKRIINILKEELASQKQHMSCDRIRKIHSRMSKLHDEEFFCS